MEYNRFHYNFINYGISYIVPDEVCLVVNQFVVVRYNHHTMVLDTSNGYINVTKFLSYYNLKLKQWRRSIDPKDRDVVLSAFKYDRFKLYYHYNVSYAYTLNGTYTNIQNMYTIALWAAKELNDMTIYNNAFVILFSLQFLHTNLYYISYIDRDIYINYYKYKPLYIIDKDTSNPNPRNKYMINTGDKYYKCNYTVLYNVYPNHNVVNKMKHRVRVSSIKERINSYEENEGKIYVIKDLKNITISNIYHFVQALYIVLMEDYEGHKQRDEIDDN